MQLLHYGLKSSLLYERRTSYNQFLEDIEVTINKSTFYNEKSKKYNAYLMYIMALAMNLCPSENDNVLIF